MSSEKVFINSKSAVKLLMFKLWPYLKRHRRLLIPAIGLILVSTGLALISPWLLGYIVDEVILKKNRTALVGFAALLLAVEVIRGFSIFSQNWLLNLAGQKTLHDLRQALLSRYQRYPMREYHLTAAGKMVTRLINDTSGLQDLFSGGVVIALGQVIIICAILVWLVFLHPTLGFVCISVFPIMLFSTNYFAKKLRTEFRESRTILASLNAFLAENISGMTVIHRLGKEKFFRGIFNQISDDFAEANGKTVKVFAHFQPTVTVLSSLSMAIFIWFGGFLIIGGTQQRTGLTLGVLVTFMSYLQSLFTPIRDITEKYNIFLASMSSCEKIFEFMDRPEEGKISNPRPLKLTTAPKVEFQDIEFTYQDVESLERWGLKKLNLTISPGEKLGIVGRSGAGKTSIANLLLRLYDADSGSLLYDKRDIRKSIGYVPQIPFLFSGTVADNLFLWKPELEIRFHQLPEAVKAPFLSEQLNLKNLVSENASNLSLGEAQMIVMMRAMLQNPWIIIMDEASAHVDSHTESWFTEVLQSSMKNKSCIVIAHRLATLKNLDRIVVLDQGKIIESGNPTELLVTGSLYKRFHEFSTC